MPIQKRAVKVRPFVRRVPKHYNTHRPPRKY